VQKKKSNSKANERKRAAVRARTNKIQTKMSNEKKMDIEKKS